MKQYLVRRWFLLVLLLVLTLGISLSRPFSLLTSQPLLRQSIVFVVMFLMALPLQADAMWQALRRPLAPLLASGINYGLIPLFAWLVTAGLMIGVQLSPDTGYGMLVAASTPCTLASASVWTRRAGGNDAVSILVTILTNSLCFLIMPAWLLVMIGETPLFHPRAMIVKLAILVVAPIVLAQLLRLFKPAGRWATAKKTPLSVAAQCGVLSMVFFGAIQTGNRLAGQFHAVWLELAVMMPTMLGVHALMLLFGLRVSRWARLPRADAIAVGFAGSQKTLMVGLEVCAQLGVTMLPMVTYHVGQLLIDTVVADRLRRQADPIKASNHHGNHCGEADSLEES